MRRPVLAFVPFAVIGTVHLATLAVHDPTLSTVTKWLLMPALLVAILISRPRTTSWSIPLLVIAVALSWGGDVMLGMPGDIGFLIGLGGFFLAHVVYVILFVSRLRVRRVSWVVIAAFLVWWAALLFVLAPHLGALLIPVAVYGLVLGASAATALACNPWVGAGGVLFLASDTILAFKLFYPGFSLWQADFVIMLLYLAAQGLIAFGATRVWVAASREPVLA